VRGQPRKGEARDAPHAEGPEVHHQQQADSSDAARAQRDARDKAITTAMAKAAIAGWTMHLIDDGDGLVFVLSRWGRRHELPDLAAVERWLNQLGAPK
jgi:hypothetical protein